MLYNSYRSIRTYVYNSYLCLSVSIAFTKCV